MNAQNSCWKTTAGRATSGTKKRGEQLSVLSEERFITAELLQRTMPQLFSRHLPVPTNGAGFAGKNGGEFQERELLYKVLFDMKNDLNDLKSMFFKLVESNNLRMPELGNLRQLSSNYSNANESFFEDHGYSRRPNRAFIPLKMNGLSRLLLILKFQRQF